MQFFQKILLLVPPMATLLVGLGRRLARFQAEPSLLAVGTSLGSGHTLNQSKSTQFLPQIHRFHRPCFLYPFNLLSSSNKWCI
jgi:hypothetical protein